ncbi:putative glycosyltransferase [Leptolyngbyaceae cyanobacterium JSC-12]|nr:putative glycosyltransferase [Leptolyngbyaceae cyanobacterium JSC-12]
MPRVSIVLVNYNYANYLEERIQSFLNQTYKDFELIILENGSTDESVEIIQRYETDNRVKAVFYPENQPLFERFNLGVDLAQGEYLLIASSDDSCHPELLEKLVEKLDNYPNVGLVYSQSWDIDSKGNRLRSWKEWTDDLSKEQWSNDYIKPGIDECRHLFFKCIIPCSGAALIRRKLFLEAGKFDTQIPLAADWMVYAKILTVSDIAYVAEPLNNFRTHSNTWRNITRLKLELEGRLQVWGYLSKKVQIPENFWQDAYEPTLRWWIRSMFSNEFSFHENWKIYRLFREIDSRVNQRIVDYFVYLFWQKFQISKLRF